MVEFNVIEENGRTKASDVTGPGGAFVQGDGGGGRGRGVCFDFQKGQCTRGESCRFSHEGGGG